MKKITMSDLIDIADTLPPDATDWYFRQASLKRRIKFWDIA